MLAVQLAPDKLQKVLHRADLGDQAVGELDLEFMLDGDDQLDVIEAHV